MVDSLRGLVVFSVLATLPGLAGSNPQEESVYSQLAERVSRLEATLREERRGRGAKLFARACAACHGRSGRGDGPAARDLDPAPRDLTARQIRFRSTPSGRPPRPEDLERTIRRGLPGSAMPAFGNLLSSHEIADLIQFIEALRPTTDDVTPAEPLPISAVPPATESSIREGRAVYMLSGCWRCHGIDGAGRGPSAMGLTDENERPILTTDFRYDPLKGGTDPEAVVRTLRTGLNGAPMPSYDAAMLFAREDFDDLSSLPDGFGLQERRDLEGFLAISPSRADLERLGTQGLDSLRDERLAALAHYVISLDRRRGFRFRLFLERPELQGRE